MNELEYKVEIKRISLEKSKSRFEFLKWVVIAIGAAVSFKIIDVGKLKLEEYKAQKENERQLLFSYLNAMESSDPEVWKRKIQFLLQYSEDPKIRDFSDSQIDYISSYAELDALYRETLSIASNLSIKGGLDKESEAESLKRFEQLYWAELPLAGESEDVTKAMIQFRDAYYEDEQFQDAGKKWKNLNLKLIELATAIRASMPSKPINQYKKLSD